MYFKVEAKVGHVSKNKFMIQSYYITATSAKEAALTARFDCPRVKHHHKDAIISVTKITYEDYIRGNIEFRNDPYNQCKNIQEQRQYCPDLYQKLYDEENQYSKNWRKEKDFDKPYNKKKAVKFGYKNGKQIRSKHINSREYDDYDYAV